MHPLEHYLQQLHDVYATGAGVKEESHYGALENLLNEVGSGLKPHVRCVGQLSNTGAGEPDFGLFTQDQFPRGEQKPLPGQPPTRGVIEVKGPDEPLDGIVSSKQVQTYLSTYGLVLVTNYREFRLLGLQDGRPVTVESFTLAHDAATLWALAVHPRKAATDSGALFVEFLQRVLLYNAPLTDPKVVAWFLASYARDARTRVEHANVPALAAVQNALEEALGLSFQGDRGNHFFRSTLVQTLFYGLFAAWVLWQQRGALGRFDWRTAGWELHVPMIQVLYEQLSMSQRLRPLGLEEVMERAVALLNRVDADAFFAQFSQEQAVQYFYEPFLEAFDPQLRKELGVWYTPTEVVQYMVARVDTVLREELGIANGLADPNVYILDPCCGTGAYLVEVLRCIRQTLDAEGMGALAELKLKEAAMQRVFGFEILPAPFVIAHLQLGLLLHTFGNALSSAQERVGVYLTNALTGWEPPTEETKKKLQLLLHFSPEMREEVDAAARVKQSNKILVVLGNPPYNGFAGMAVAEERDLSNAYRTTRNAPAPQGQGLNDLYIRFYRMAERQIVERAHQGVICYISNYSWLDGLSFTGMREQYLTVFDRIWVDCLNGDKYKTGKVTPEGDPDPSVFSTERNREGIQVGTAISLLVCSGKQEGTPDVQFRHLWGKQKRQELLSSLEVPAFTNLYTTVTPQRALGYPFIPAKVNASFLTWPLLTDLFPVSFPGIQTSRDDMVVDIDRDRLVERMQQYFDQTVSHEDMARIAPGVMTNTGRFRAEEVRETLRKRGLLQKNFVRFLYRPFDVRWLYWEPETKLLDEKRAEYVAHVFKENYWFSLAQRNRKEFSPPCVSTCHTARHLIERGANLFPLKLQVQQTQGSLFETSIDTLTYNLSELAQQYCERVHCSAEDLYFHTLATLHTPLYQVENPGALRQDWPRIPLPTEKSLLLDSAGLGRIVAVLLDPEAPVEGVTTGQIRPELLTFGVPAKEGAGSLQAEDLAVTAGWGYAGQGGVTMPAKGKVVERSYTADERASLLRAPERHALTEDQVFACLGQSTFDIYLNDIAYWQNVPARVWAYTLGGYQVLKKWLSYRERALLGRPLTHEEVFYVTHVVRRIAALLLLEPVLDRVYEMVKADVYSETPFQ